MYKSLRMKFKQALNKKTSENFQKFLMLYDVRSVILNG